MSVLDRCPSHKEYSYSKRTYKRQEPTPGVRLMESIVKVKGLKKRQGPTPGVCLREVSVSWSIVTVKGLKKDRDQHQVSILERCPSHREYSYSKRTEKKAGTNTGYPS